MLLCANARMISSCSGALEQPGALIIRAVRAAVKNSVKKRTHSPPVHDTAQAQKIPAGITRGDVR